MLRVRVLKRMLVLLPSAHLALLVRVGRRTLISLKLSEGQDARSVRLLLVPHRAINHPRRLLDTVGVQPFLRNAAISGGNTSPFLLARHSMSPKKELSHELNCNIIVIYLVLL